MKLRLEPVSAIALSILLGWAWHKVTDKPVCYVYEVVNGQTVIKPVLCETIYNEGSENESEN